VHQRIVLSILLLLITAACRTSYRQPLPAPIDAAATVNNARFSGPSEGWPPRPTGNTNVQVVASTPGPLTEEMVPGLRAVAEANAEVRAALGARFAYVSSGLAEPEKQAATAVRPFRLIYFSHDRNVGVDVRLDRDRVLSVSDMRYQPPAGQEEIALAVEIARRDPRLREAAANLQGEGIRLDPQRGQPGYGNRILYVAFSRPESEHTEYGAIVDLTRQELLSFTTVGKRSQP
jgi:hypothetical protein